MWAALGAFGLIATGLGFLSVLYPLRWVGIRRRKQGAILLAVGIAATVVAVTNTPPPPSNTSVATTDTSASTTTALPSSQAVPAEAATATRGPSNVPENTTAVEASEGSPTSRPRVEYRTTPTSNGIIESVLVYFDQRPTAGDVEAALREALTAGLASGQLSVDQDIYGSALLRSPGGSGDPEQLILPDGSDGMVYMPAIRAVVTTAEWNQQRVAAAPQGTPLVVTLSITVGRSNQGAVIVRGETNLPTGTPLMASMYDLHSRLLAQAQSDVRNGRFAFEGMTSRGAPYPSNTYVFSITSPMASMQPAAVRATIGDLGQNLTGPLVTTGLGGHSVDARFRVAVP